MKKLNRILILGVVSVFLFSTVAADLNNMSYSPVDESFEEIVLAYIFSKPNLEKIEVKGEIYDRITINGLPNSGGLHKSCLPVKPLKILLPYGKKIDSIDVVASERISFGPGYSIERGHNIIPITNDLGLKSSKREDDSISSENLYSTMDMYIFRGYTIVFVNLYPVQYMEETGEIVFYEHMILDINTKESQSNNIIRGLQRDVDIVRNLVENPLCISSYDNAPKSTFDETIEYVIITDEALANSTGEYTFQDLVQSKIDKGMTAEIFTVEEIVGNSSFWVNGTWGDNNPDNPFNVSIIIDNYELFNDTQAKIRNFIRYAHLELGTDYVLLGGDADEITEEDNIIPIRGLYACEEGLPLQNGLLDFEEDDIPSDVYYACLDGNFNYDMDERWGENATNNNVTDVEEADLLAEVYVGRACVDAEDEVSNFVMKTLGYEASDEEPYLVKALMVGEYLGFPGISQWGGNYKDLIIPKIPEDFNVDTLYERDMNWNKHDLIEILNYASPHIINHLGHGNQDYALKLYNDDILTLSNEKYFFIYSQTCLAGSFDNWHPWHGYVEEDSAAEHFTVETSYGAFAVIMNARYGLGSEDTLYAPSQILDESFYDALFNKSIRQLGRANHYSKEDHIWHINENGIRWVYYETNLFGDPEVSIKDPQESNVELTVDITHPENSGLLYIINRKICRIPLLNVPLVIGKIIVQAEALSNPDGYIYSVEFYLDDESQDIDYNYPYEWEINKRLFGRHTITAMVHGFYGEKESKTIDTIMFILGDITT